MMSTNVRQITDVNSLATVTWYQVVKLSHIMNEYLIFVINKTWQLIETVSTNDVHFILLNSNKIVFKIIGMIKITF